jgi:hypothetical protein
MRTLEDSLLVGAYRTPEYDDTIRYPLEVYDDAWWGKLWVYGDEFGATHVVRAQSSDDALDCIYDLLTPIPEDELDEAFPEGPEGDLAEGYQFQSNATGTGIVFPGFYEWLVELTPEVREKLGVTVCVEDWY